MGPAGRRLLPERALALNYENPRIGLTNAKLQQALQLHRQGKLADAEVLYREVLQRTPGDFVALHRLGLIASHRKRFDDAVRLIDQALAGTPDYARALNDRGIAFHRMRRLDAALESYDRALALKPDYAEALSNRATALKDLGRLDEALASYDAALALRPEYADALYNRGNTLTILDRLDEAVASYDRALAIRPEYADAWNNRGNAQRKLKRPGEALESYDQALAIRPDYAQALTNRGIALKDMKQLDAALAWFEKAQTIRPDYPELPWNEGLCRLLTGDFEAGWQKYELRWQSDALRHAKRDFTQPVWLGAPDIAGKTVLLHAEQGMGDTIQFCRYAKRVAATGATVLLEVQQPLKTLLSGVAGVARLLGRDDALPPFDYHCPLLSLPLAFKTTLETIPAENPYFRADPDRVRRWREKIGEETRPRVGFAWSGNAATINDGDRSIPLAEFISLVSDSAQFFTLQKDVRPADRAVLEARNDIVHFGADFADTAALIELMDVVVTVDTSIGHLAGAMGKPAWILLPFVPDWRWMLDRDTSPWYPTARLFRQPTPGDWDSVIANAAAQISLLKA